MKRAFVVFAFCALAAAPGVAFGQPSGPAPEQRDALDKAHADAKAAAYAVLTAPHVASVSAIAAQVAAGSLDRRAASGQIDALLTPTEAKAVLAAAVSSRKAMRAAMMAAGGPPPPPAGPSGGGEPPGMAGPPMGPDGPPPPGGGRFGPPSAGRYLLMVSLSPRGMRGHLPPRAGSSPAP